MGSSGTANGGGLTLQVRRGSEPALNRLSPVHLSPPDPSKRWSAAPKIDEDKDDRKVCKILYSIFKHVLIFLMMTHPAR